MPTGMRGYKNREYIMRKKLLTLRKEEVRKSGRGNKAGEGMGKSEISKRICTLSVCNNLKENSKKTSLLRNEVSTYTRDIRVFCQGPRQSH